MENYNKKPHRRKNILTGEWVLVSPQRTMRPWQGNKEKKPVENKMGYDPNCYLCPGNERVNKAKNPDYTQTFSFVNDFSALVPEKESKESKDGFLELKTEPGICKVVCFSPDHSLTLPLMSVPEIQKVIELWIKEYEDLGRMEFINHVQIFENKGEIMGCSNPHPHSQIWAQHTIPDEVMKKQMHQESYWSTHKTSLLSGYLQQELDEGSRILLENDDFVALVPYWAIWPFESMVIPKKHYRHIGELSGREVESFADILKRLTIKYDNLFEVSFPYSAGIHQAPTDGKDHEGWHFHMSFYPPLLRSADIKKFMVGYEMFASPQRDITAEMAAESLRNLPDVHYLIKNQ